MQKAYETLPEERKKKYYEPAERKRPRRSGKPLPVNSYRLYDYFYSEACGTGEPKDCPLQYENYFGGRCMCGNLFR